MVRIALFHPWIKSRGGGEKVILEILKNKNHEVDIYTWVYDKENTFDEFEKFKINVIAPKIAKKLSRYYVLRGLFFPISLFSKIPLEKYDLFLISTSGLAELITLRNHKPGKTFSYVHTILRASYSEDIKWNLKHRYKDSFSKLLYLIAAKIYLKLEKISWKKIDVAIFNSELSFQRTKKHDLINGKKTHIIHPPIEVDKFKKLKIKKGDYFLYVSRFHPTKRQDVLIRAWSEFTKKHPEYRLILGGNIENRKYFDHIKNLARKTKNIEIRTNVQDDERLKLFAGCLAGIFIPFIEDFGIVPFEILATGKPLITVNKGGYTDLIKEIPQVTLINEKYNEKEMIKETMEGLERFLRSKVKPKKIIIKGISSQNFIRRLNKVF